MLYIYIYIRILFIYIHTNISRDSETDFHEIVHPIIQYLMPCICHILSPHPVSLHIIPILSYIIYNAIS